MTINKNQLLGIMPKASVFADSYVTLINKFAQEFNVRTKQQMAYFLATIALESSQLTRFNENLNYSADRLIAVFPKYFNRQTANSYAHNPKMIGSRIYANRMGNGNEASGDGYKYRGRGAIQITGKAMYAKYSEYCGVDLTAQPELLEKPFGALRSAFWFFFKYMKLQELCDKGDTKAIRKKVNGGLNGYSTFFEFYNTALKHMH